MLSSTPYVCPHCYGSLSGANDATALVCNSCSSIYPIIAGIPVLIFSENTSNKRDASSFDYLAHYQLDSETFDYFQQNSGATEHSERRLREYITSLIPKSITSILDVGCGSAWIAKKFVRNGVEVFSLDASATNPTKAMQLYPGKNHHGVAADAYKLPFEDNTFDCIVAAEIIEHVVDPHKFIAELFRVVKQGGSLIISTPFKEILKYELCIHCNHQTPHNAHLHSFDENKLRSLYIENDLKEFTSRAFNNKLLLFARTYILLRYFPFSFWRLIDRVANLIVKKPVNVIVTYVKK